MEHLKLKKIRVRFPNLVSGQMVVGECVKQVMKLPQVQDINNRIYSELFAGSSGMSVGARMLPKIEGFNCTWVNSCLLYTSPSPRDKRQSRMPSSA